LADAIAFFQAFAGMETGFRQRADDVMVLLHDEVSRFVLVASPRADTIEEARYFADRLQRSNLSVAATVVNRCTPTFGELPASRSDEDDAAALYDNLAELNAAATAERTQASALLADEAVHTTWVPTLPTDVHSLDSLNTIRGLLFD
jgi:anion-transporting  ArsA/GET3 family ATPase